VQIRKQPAVNMLSKHTVHVELREAIRECRISQRPSGCASILVIFMRWNNDLGYGICDNLTNAFDDAQFVMISLIIIIIIKCTFI